jgi:tRNA pseudouridine55 synthase
VGESLGCGGLIDVLTRTRIGPFRREDAIDPSTLSREAIPGLLRPAAEAVADLPRVEVSVGEVERLLTGQAIAPPRPVSAGEVAMIGPGGDLVAIGEVEGGSGRIAPRRVLAGGRG